MLCGLLWFESFNLFIYSFIPSFQYIFENVYKIHVIPRDKIRDCQIKKERKYGYGNNTRAKFNMCCHVLSSTRGRNRFSPELTGLRYSNKTLLRRNSSSGSSWRGQGVMRKTFPISTSDSEFHLITSHGAHQFMAKAKVKCNKSNCPKNSHLPKTKVWSKYVAFGTMAWFREMYGQHILPIVFLEYGISYLCNFQEMQSREFKVIVSGNKWNNNWAFIEH